MAGVNVAAVLHKERDIRIEEKTIPEPGRDEVQIRVGCVGICGSDTTLWRHCEIGGLFVVEAPHIQGHEFSGVVTKLGDGVTDLKEGDRVAVEPIRVCHRCEFCISGRYNLCENMRFSSLPPVNGSLIQYLVHPAEYVFKLPDNMSLEEGALVESLSVGLYAVRRARLAIGNTLLISGTGPIGMCTLLAAQAVGVTRIVMTDPIQARLDLAKQMGATHTLQIDEKISPKAIAAQITEMMGGPVDRAIDCSGAEHATQVAVEALKKGSVLGLVGFGGTYTSVPMISIIAKELELIGGIMYTGTYPTALEMISLGKCKVAPLVSHKYTLQEAHAAFEMAHSRKGMKVMIECNPKTQA